MKPNQVPAVSWRPVHPAQFPACLPINTVAGSGIVDLFGGFFHKVRSLNLRLDGAASRCPTPRTQHENHCRYWHRSSRALFRG
jgi:hypothetical protein